MLEIKNISKAFGPKKVLSNINIAIEEGTVFGLVGINGAGKSTLLRLISGIYKADAGSIEIDGEVAYENENAKSKLFFLPDEPFYSLNTTALSIMDLYKAFYTFSKDEYLDYLNHFNIPLNKTLKNFSKGMKRQVFISLALAIKPKYLLLDEAFDGLDPLARLAFRKEIAKMLADKNTTVIISSHSLRELEDICDSYALLDNQQISSSGIINDEIQKYHKYQLAFMDSVEKNDFTIDYKTIEIDKRIVKIVTTLEYEEFTKAIEYLHPVIIDEVNVDFEELFMIEVESRGYVK